MKYQKIIIIISLLALILIATGCDRRSSCSLSPEKCTYYSGTEGITMYQENRQHTLYYRSSDRGIMDANQAIFDVRVENRGASDAIGAIFITGFAPEFTKMEMLDETGTKTSINPRGIDGYCYIDMLPSGANLNPSTWLGNIFGVFSCKGIDGSAYGDDWRIRADFETLAREMNWNLGILEKIDIELAGSEGLDTFRLGIDGEYFDASINGKGLVLLLNQLNFKNWGGSEFRMQGDHPNNPGGDMDVKTFLVSIVGEWPAGEDYFKIPYQIKSCYGYTTFVSPSACVDSDPYSNEEKNCYAETMNFGGSQGAPVAITRMEQFNTGKELVFTFTVRNVGNGRVWDVGHLESCSPYFPTTPRSTMMDVVYIGPALIGAEPLLCSNRRIRLNPQTGEGTFTCRYEYDSNAYDVGGGYVIPIKMELWYGYEEVLKDQIIVRRTN